MPIFLGWLLIRLLPFRSVDSGDDLTLSYPLILINKKVLFVCFIFGVCDILCYVDIED